MLDRAAALKIAIPFIAARESLQLRAYWDNGAWSIGYGHRGVAEHSVITEDAADELLQADADQFAGFIQPHLPDQNPNQFAALISLSFNIGLGKKGVKDGFLVQKSGEKSTILSLLQANAEIHTIGDAFLAWIYEGGVPLSSLCTRRTLERKLYLTPFTPPGESPLSEAPGSSSDGGLNSEPKGS